MLCWLMSIIPVLSRMRQEDSKFEESLGYIYQDSVSKIPPSPSDHTTLLVKNPLKSDIVTHTCNPSSQGAKAGGSL